jgi:hypothetical protein
MAFSAHEVRVLRRALALAPEAATTDPAARDEPADFWLLDRAIGEAEAERIRMRAFTIAELGLQRAALPGTAGTYLRDLEAAVDRLSYVPTAADLAALRRLGESACGAGERRRRAALLARCTRVAEADVERRLAERARERERAERRVRELAEAVPVVVGAMPVRAPAPTPVPVPVPAQGADPAAGTAPAEPDRVEPVRAEPARAEPGPAGPAVPRPFAAGPATTGVLAPDPVAGVAVVAGGTDAAGAPGAGGTAETGGALGDVPAAEIPAAGARVPDGPAADVPGWPGPGAAVVPYRRPVRVLGQLPAPAEADRADVLDISPGSSRQALTG